MIPQRPQQLIQRLICGDCLAEMAKMPDDSVGLVFGSPPYEDCRTYGIGFKLKGQEWVDWMVEVYRQSLRVCKGLVAFVVQGKTCKYKWSCTPAFLIADLHRAGFNVRNPPVFNRFGIPGSGSIDWLRSDYEWIVCVSHPGRLFWSDNTACGGAPKYKAGGKLTCRKKSGERVNHKDQGVWGIYEETTKCNPGNVLSIPVGGGIMGNPLCHENEAPFPEKLAEFFIKSFCPLGGVVLDPFLGSGTTVAVAKRLGRGYIGIDIRQSQIELTERRLVE